MILSGWVDALWHLHREMRSDLSRRIMCSKTPECDCTEWLQGKGRSVGWRLRWEVDRELPFRQNCSQALIHVQTKWATQQTVITEGSSSLETLALLQGRILPPPCVFPQKNEWIKQIFWWSPEAFPRNERQIWSKARCVLLLLYLGAARGGVNLHHFQRLHMLLIYWCSVCYNEKDMSRRQTLKSDYFPHAHLPSVPVSSFLPFETKLCVTSPPLRSTFSALLLATCQCLTHHFYSKLKKKFF